MKKKNKKQKADFKGRNILIIITLLFLIIFFVLFLYKYLKKK
jgi:hypothetical protein